MFFEIFFQFIHSFLLGFASLAQHPAQARQFKRQHLISLCLRVHVVDYTGKTGQKQYPYEKYVINKKLDTGQNHML